MIEIVIEGTLEKHGITMFGDFLATADNTRERLNRVLALETLFKRNNGHVTSTELMLYSGLSINETMEKDGQYPLWQLVGPWGRVMP